MTQNISDKFWVNHSGREYECFGKKNLKTSKICVGDMVEICEVDGAFQISKQYSRQNFLIRPPVANIDKLFIVVAAVPEPDYFVVDKMLLFAFVNKIEPIILVNKVDEFGFDLFENLKAVYQNVCQIFCVSARSGYNINVLKDAMRSSISAFAGQSAVGKSSLVNALIPNLSQKIGDLSQRIERGKNTTTHCKLCEIEENSFIIWRQNERYDICKIFEEYADFQLFPGAIDEEGNLWAWGENQIGELGDGTTTMRRNPIQIKKDTHIK